MSTEVLGRAVIDNIRAMLQRPLEVRTHHGVVHNDDRVLALLLHQGADARDIDYLKERVRRGLEEHHGGLARVKVRNDTVRLRCVDMVHGDTHVRAEVSKETVGTAVQVVPRDDLATWFEKARAHVESGHAAGDCKGMSGRGYLCNMVFCAQERQSSTISYDPQEFERASISIRCIPSRKGVPLQNQESSTGSSDRIAAETRQTLLLPRYEDQRRLT